MGDPQPASRGPKPGVVIAAGARCLRPLPVCARPPSTSVAVVRRERLLDRWLGFPLVERLLELSLLVGQDRVIEHGLPVLEVELASPGRVVRSCRVTSSSSSPDRLAQAGMPPPTALVGPPLQVGPTSVFQPSGQVEPTHLFGRIGKVTSRAPSASAGPFAATAAAP